MICGMINGGGAANWHNWSSYSPTNTTDVLAKYKNMQLNVLSDKKHLSFTHVLHDTAIPRSWKTLSMVNNEPIY
jgi:hypothetical protein